MFVSFSIKNDIVMRRQAQQIVEVKEKEEEEEKNTTEMSRARKMRECVRM